MRIQQQMLDSLGATRQAMRTLRGDVQNDLYGVQQQLVQLGELTGQSQRRLSELRAQLERRGEEIAQAQAAGDTTAAAVPAGPSAEQIYETSLGQLRLGSAGTARSGFAELLRAHPTSERVPDALYYIGQSFETENADSALAYYDQVVRNHPESPRSASALYHVGLIRERANRNAEARQAYQRVVDSYPNSDEAALARDRLRALGR
jgi:tol-pal system protein YbgF